MTRALVRLLHPPRPPRLLIVGDMILDRYQYGTSTRISPEAPIPVLAATREELRLGGCGNVAANLAALGARTRVVAVVGADEAADDIRTMLQARGCPCEGLVVDRSRPTIRKTRLVAQSQQLLRIDEERVGRHDGQVEEELLARIEAALPEVDAVVVSDYGKGVLSPRVLERLLRRRGGPPVLVDPKGRDYGRYRGAALVTPNRGEAETATGLQLDTPETIREAAVRLCEVADLQAVIVTLGAQGMYGRTADGATEVSIPARARSVYDVTGAGDTVIAVVAFAMAAGSDLEQAMRLATVAAGITVQRFGVVAVTPSDIESALTELTGLAEKVLERGALITRLEHERSQGRRIVFTNGCFDVLHVGHLQYLQEARSYGDVLVVGVNSDASVRRLKGDGRPVNVQGDRMALLAGLECVSFVIGFDDDTPQQLIEAVSPDVLVKGEDWADKGVVGREWVESRGGHVVLAPLRQGYSTTATLQRMGVEPSP